MNCSDIGIISLATDDIADIRAISFRNKHFYARAHGYVWMPRTQNLDRSRSPSWSKILLLKAAATTTNLKWLLWTDADSVVLNPGIKLESFIDNNSDIIISRDVCGINAGQFFVRLCQATVDFFQCVWNQTQFINHPWWEQAAIAHLIDLGYPIRLKYISKRLLNSYPDDYQPGDFILHVPGVPNKAGLLQRFLRTPASNRAGRLTLLYRSMDI